MSAWGIRVPIASRDDALADVALASRAIADPEERAVAYQLAVDAAPSGAVTLHGAGPRCVSPHHNTAA